MLNFQVACAASKYGMLLLISIYIKIWSKYRRATPKNLVFSISRCHYVFNLYTCSLLHEISSLTQLCIFE